MPDYIYLLENRLSAVQQSALKTVRELARDAQMTVFLAGGAVRDLTCGYPVRELEVVVNGNALELKDALLKAGAQLWGEDTEARSLFLYFPGSVRLEFSSAKRVEYPKAGIPTYHWESIQEDLRTRDFTINAMAISLNEGSFGLLMDPTNGVADMEARVLRLVSNYGFLDNPVRLIAATRYKARLGFDLEERTQVRYENAKGDEVIEYLSDAERGWELEAITHEEDPLKVLEAHEAEGWIRYLYPAWTAAKADTEKLTALHDLAVELQIQGIYPDISAPQMQLLTAKIPAKDLPGLKKLLARPGFVEQWNNLDAAAAEFAKVLLSKENAAPSATYKLITSYQPEAVLWLAFTSKQAAVKEKFENFLKVWPQARQRIPFAMMAEMRITAELPIYAELVKSIFLQLIDGGLATPEEMRALLEPHSPPAPPPPVTIKRTRAKKGAEPRAKARATDDDEEDSESDELDAEDSGDEEDIDGLELEGDDMDFSLGGDDVRPVIPSEDGEEDDVFARDSVGDDLDLDADVDLDDEDGAAEVDVLDDLDGGLDDGPADGADDSDDAGDLDDPLPGSRGAKAGRSAKAAKPAKVGKAKKK